MPSARKKIVLGLLVAALLVAAAVFFLTPRRFEGPVNALQLDLARPDALIRTRSLSRLPADLLRVPLMRDVLTEDFVDYYEHHERRLALAGTVRRIAYEHSLSLPERLIESVFDEPAEVALWRGGDGSLRHFAVAMTRNGLARALQMVLPALPGDAQLASAGTLAGTDDPVLVLQYGYRDRLVLVARGDRVVALSDPGMLLAPPPQAEAGEEAGGAPADPPPQDPRVAELVRRLLDADGKAASPFAEHFELAGAAGGVHELVLGSAAFTFGYDAFAPGVAALSFAFDDQGGWRTAALLDGARLPAGGLDGAAVWAALPHGASLCALAPADWGRLAPLAGSLGAEPAAARELAGAFAGPGAVCLYGESRLYTPLFAAGFGAAPEPARGEQLAALFAAAVGKGAPDQRPPVEAVTRPDSARLWRRSVETPFGAEQEGTRALAPSLALQGRTVLFSPDGALIDKALDVAAKVYPAQADSLPDAALTLAVVDPAPLAALVRKEVFAALPRDEEAALRNAADAHLLPRLEVLAKYPAFRLVRSDEPVGGGRAWRELKWVAMERR